MSVTPGRIRKTARRQLREDGYITIAGIRRRVADLDGSVQAVLHKALGLRSELEIMNNGPINREPSYQLSCGREMLNWIGKLYASRIS